MVRPGKEPSRTHKRRPSTLNLRRAGSPHASAGVLRPLQPQPRHTPVPNADPGQAAQPVSPHPIHPRQVAQVQGQVVGRYKTDKPPPATQLSVLQHCGRMSFASADAAAPTFSSRSASGASRRRLARAHPTCTTLMINVYHPVPRLCARKRGHKSANCHSRRPGPASFPMTLLTADLKTPLPGSHRRGSTCAQPTTMWAQRSTLTSTVLYISANMQRGNSAQNSPSYGETCNVSEHVTCTCPCTCPCRQIRACREAARAVPAEE